MKGRIYVYISREEYTPKTPIVVYQREQYESLVRIKGRIYTKNTDSCISKGTMYESLVHIKGRIYVDISREEYTLKYR
jgi:hypothetical protein